MAFTSLYLYKVAHGNDLRYIYLVYTTIRFLETVNFGHEHRKHEEFGKKKRKNAKELYTFSKHVDKVSTFGRACKMPFHIKKNE